MSNFLTALASIVIAFATIKTWLVYQRMSQQIEKQINQTREQIGLTRDMFLESHKPALSVSVKKCEYSETDARFNMRIVTKNHGTAVANNVTLRVSIGGFNDIKHIGPIAIQPHNKVVHTFAIPMSADRYKVGQTDGNRFSLLVEGPYQGPAGQEYSYGERQEYYGELKRFVPFWTK